MKLKLTLVLFLVLLLSLSSVHAATISKPPYSLTLNSGLVGHWTFDGANVVNGVIRDISGQGNHGNTISIATSTFYTAGKIGQGLQFDGVDDYINRATVNHNIGTGDFTMSAWVNPSRLGIYNGIMAAGVYDPVFSVNPGSVQWGAYWGGERSSGNTLTLNIWTHVTFLRRSGILYFYENGVQTPTTHSLASSISNGSFSIGWNGINSYCQCKIDDARLYNRALSTTEIAKLYNFGASKLNVTKTPTGLQSGLVGHWTFDGKDMSGGVARDISGQGNHGNTVSIATSTFYTQGRIGQGVKFDGVDDYVNVPAATSINDLNTITACVWVNPPGGFGVEFQSLIIKTNDAGTTGWDLYLRNEGANGTGVGTSFAGGGNFDYIENRTPVVLYNVWSHVCMTQNGDGSANMKLYVNGVNVNIQGSRDSGTRVSDSSNTLKIGSNTSAKIKGVMDDARVYNRVLTASEITFLYSLGAPKQNVTISPTGLKSGLVGHWTFDGKDMSGGVARDISGQGNNGKLTNIATSTFYTQGRIGQGVFFADTNNLITIAHTAAQNPASITISFWIKVNQTGTKRFVDKGSTSYIVRDSGNQMEFVTTSGCDTFFSSTGTQKANEWQHWIITAGSGGCTWYLNGIQTNTTATAFTGGSSTSDLLLSSSLDGLNNTSMDDVRIYNRVLSASEILQLYNIGK